jgi:hypothetical protein
MNIRGNKSVRKLKVVTLMVFGLTLVAPSFNYQSHAYSPLHSTSIVSGYTGAFYSHLNYKWIPNYQQEWTNAWNTWGTWCWNCQTVNGYTSFFAFQQDMRWGGANVMHRNGVSYVAYSPESGDATWQENNNRVYYARQFYYLPHQYGFKVIQIPSLVYVNKHGVSGRASISDMFDYESEYIETNIGAWRFANAVCSTVWQFHNAWGGWGKPFFFEEVAGWNTWQATNAFEQTMNICGWQIFGMYVSGYGYWNQLSSLVSVGLIHW